MPQWKRRQLGGGPSRKRVTQTGGWPTTLVPVEDGGPRTSKHVEEPLTFPRQQRPRREGLRGDIFLAVSTRRPGHDLANGVHSKQPPPGMTGWCEHHRQHGSGSRHPFETAHSSRKKTGQPRAAVTQNGHGASGRRRPRLKLAENAQQPGYVLGQTVVPATSCRLTRPASRPPNTSRRPGTVPS